MIKKISRMPTFGEHAKAARLPLAYSVAYRFESNSAAHPTPLLIDRFIDGTAAGFRILASADGDRPDPYVTSAHLMWAVLTVAGELIDHRELQSGLDEAKRALERLQRPS